MRQGWVCGWKRAVVEAAARTHLSSARSTHYADLSFAPPPLLTSSSPPTACASPLFLLPAWPPSQPCKSITDSLWSWRMCDLSQTMCEVVCGRLTWVPLHSWPTPSRQSWPFPPSTTSHIPSAVHNDPPLTLFDLLISSTTCACADAWQQPHSHSA